MLNPNDLKNILTDALFEKEYPDNWNALSDGLKGFIEDNLILTGVYVGIIPPAAPDPLSGPYTWSPASVIVPPGSALANMAKAGTASVIFPTLVSQTILGITFVGGDTKGLVNLLAPVKLPPTVPLVFVPSPDFDINMLNLATGIVTSILGSLPPLPPAAPTASSGGTGVTTFALLL